MEVYVVVVTLVVLVRVVYRAVGSSVLLIIFT
jgi:hypothetical protein